METVNTLSFNSLVNNFKFLILLISKILQYVINLFHRVFNINSRLSTCACRIFPIYGHPAAVERFLMKFEFYGKCCKNINSTAFYFTAALYHTYIRRRGSLHTLRSAR